MPARTESDRPTASARFLHATVGALASGCTSCIVIATVLHPDLGGLGAVGGFFVGLIGGAFARAKTWQVAITAALWGAMFGPIVGMLLLAAAMAAAGVGM